MKKPKEPPRVPAKATEPPPGQPDDRPAVGYKNPPEHTRFQPGNSFGRRGRPKGRRNRKTLVREIIDENLIVREGDRRRQMTAFQAMLKGLRARALKGDVRAMEALLRLGFQTGALSEDEVWLEVANIVTEEDKAIFINLLARFNVALDDADADEPDPPP